MKRLVNKIIFVVCSLGLVLPCYPKSNEKEIATLKQEIAILKSDSSKSYAIRWTVGAVLAAMASAACTGGSIVGYVHEKGKMNRGTGLFLIANFGLGVIGTAFTTFCAIK